MNKTPSKQENEKDEEIISSLPETADDDTGEANEPMTQEEFKEQYQKLPLWQHVLLGILFLFGFTAVIMLIDFVVEFAAELLKHIF